MNGQETCIDCHASSPADEDYTLTSSLGWRLLRERGADGVMHAVWRCGECWEKHKVAKLARLSRQFTRSRR